MFRDPGSPSPSPASPSSPTAARPPAAREGLAATLGTERPPAVPRWLVPLTALCAGVTVANIYLAYPVLPLIAAGYGVDEARVQFVITGTQLGYAAGLFLLTPLGDVVRRRRLLAVLVVCAAIGLTAAALSTGPVMFAITAACFASVTVAPHVLIPYITSVVPRQRQGRALATIGSGMTAGITLSRVLGGGIGQLWGWRALYLVAAAATLAIGLVTVAVLPREPRPASMRYHRLLASMITLLRTQPVVRRAIVVQLPIFATFNMVWVPLVFLLTGPSYGFSVATAGLVGLLSLSTMVTAPFVGRLIEARGSRIAMMAGIPLIAIGAVVMLFSSASLAAVIAGVVALAVGQQSLQISNQSRVLNVTSDGRSRVNTLFMTANFLGGSCASLAAGYVYSHAGWTGITQGALGFALLAATVWTVAEVHARREAGGPAR